MGRDDCEIHVLIVGHYGSDIMSLPNQTHSEWENERCPPKEVLERIYKNYPSVSLPMNLTSQPIISPKSRRPPASDIPQMYPPNPWWNPYPSAGPVNVPPGPFYSVSGPSTAPFYPPHPITSNISPNLPTNEETPQLPSDNNQAVDVSLGPSPTKPSLVSLR